MRIRIVLLLAAVLFCLAGSAQKKKKKDPDKPDIETPQKDTTKPKSSSPSAKGPKPYSEVVSGEAVTANGFIIVHKVKDKYYFEIPDSILNRDILIVNRIARAAAGSKAGFFGYRGDQIGSKVVRFEKGPENKIFLQTISFSDIALDSSENGMYHSLKNNNLQPLAASFDIQAFSEDSGSVVIDLTQFINGDNEILFFDSRTKRNAGVSSLLNDRSYIIGVKAFPLNVEIRTMKTYRRTTPAGTTGSSSGSVSVSSGSFSELATYELNSSFVMLPKNPMKPRYFDNRVGYFAVSTTDFDANPQGIKKVSMAVRWRLEPKDEDIEKYKRGELVEPKKPIVYYIDPTTPKKWVPYLIQGINDWQAAFEQAGFKNAIIGREAPVDDSTWSLDDARNSAIVYKPSTVANAIGPNVHDPRSGEIIESHISWYHNVMELLRNWYFIQASVNDPRGQKMEFSDELMGQLIRFVSSHEIGHTLGLRHNFGSSSTVPVENLRSQKWLDQHGHTPSVMDYARFNYVAQPEDKISPSGIYPHIGEYDRWAIQWGYTWLPQFKSAPDELGFLNKMVSDSMKNNPRLFFGIESDPDDPRNQREDLGDNAMIAGEYGIRNLKRIMPNILKWTRTENEDYDNAKTIYSQLVMQFNRYMGHVSKNIGGREWTPSVVEQDKPVYTYTSKQRQKEAMRFLQAQLFTTPEWLIDKNLFSYIGTDQVEIISRIQRTGVSRLLNVRTLNNLVQFDMMDPDDAYTVNEFLGDLKNGIWTELKSGKPITIYRRNLQKAYVESLVRLIKPPKNTLTIQISLGSTLRAPQTIDGGDAISIVKGHARTLIGEINAAISRKTDPVTKMHLQDVKERLQNALDPRVE